MNCCEGLRGALSVPVLFRGVFALRVISDLIQMVSMSIDITETSSVQLVVVMFTWIVHGMTLTCSVHVCVLNVPVCRA